MLLISYHIICFSYTFPFWFHVCKYLRIGYGKLCVPEGTITVRGSDLCLLIPEGIVTVRDSDLCHMLFVPEGTSLYKTVISVYCGDPCVYLLSLILSDASTDLRKIVLPFEYTMKLIMLSLVGPVHPSHIIVHPYVSHFSLCKLT